MKIFKKIKQMIMGCLLKRYIHNELAKKFKSANRKNKKLLNHLTESLFQASQIVKKEEYEAEWKAIERENKEMLEDVKTVFLKHYNDKVGNLTKTIKKLENETKRKDAELNIVKSNILKNINIYND